ncbi:hypothetical protein J2Y69_003238 [Microbacterium resistens]|uniref:LXG domain-containing protein n=1 Tax=Microbacterium resistens TaxID=156977 RepID=A0ABU1SG59_9MICO|nr:T7SS effector LXG polymorphic toxin [Microbacterium resistens]MDR6868614.1 hypothetical protein [Microbacterium resistens]
MSVVEFSADSWQASSPGLQKGLGNRIEALTVLAQGLESLAASSNISGKGADAMRAYVREVHVPIVQSMLVSLYTFQTAIGVYWNGYSQVDTDGSFRLVDDEFDAHLTQLDTGMGQLRGFADDLRSIAASASHLVSLGGAGATAADRTADDLERARLIAKAQQETWAAYEASDPGFSQVKELIAELKSIVKNVGTLTVGQGRDYQSGSFNLTLTTLGELTSGMLDYCTENQDIASDGWETLFNGYVDDVEAEEERKRKEDALWGMLWDGLQVVAGAVVVAIGVVGTPFTGGFSLGLTVLGGSLVVGGVNSAINHASIATTGSELNLIGMASDGIGQWYDVNVAQPAIASGDKGLQFLAGLGSGVGQVVSEAAQVNVVEIGTGIVTLATSDQARSQLWNQLTATVGQVAAGDTFVIGQIAGNLIPFGAVAKLSKPGHLLGKVDDLGLKGGKLPDFTPVKLSTPNAATSALDWLKTRLGAGGVKVSDGFTPTIRIPNGVPEKPPTPNASNRVKGEYGERVSDQYFRDLGYERLDMPKDVNAKGIDAIYQTPDGKYVIVEAKYSTSGSPKLGNTLDGPQMGNDWLTGEKTRFNRILEAVGGNTSLADNIVAALNRGEVDKIMTIVRPDGSLTSRTIP